MKNILVNLWNGNIAPIENCGKDNPEIENLIRLIEKNKDTLDGALNESQQKILARYICCMDEYISLLTEQAFCDGFCLGSQLMTEVFEKDTCIV